MRRLLALLLALTAGSSASAATVDDLLAELRARKWFVPTQNADRPETVVEAAVATRATASDITNSVAEQFGLSKTVAAALVEAKVASLALVARRPSGAKRQQELERIGRVLRAALRESRNDETVLFVYVRHASLEAETPSDFGAMVVPLFRSQADQAAATLRLLGTRPYAPTGLSHRTHELLLVADALRQKPDDFDLIAKLARASAPELRAAFGPVRVSDRSVIREEWSRKPPEVVAEYVLGQIAAFEQQGRPGEIIAVWEALSPEVRRKAATFAGPIWGGDVRAVVALAYAFNGSRDRALELLGEVPVADKKDGPARRVGAQRKVVAELVRPTGDPFDVLADLIMYSMPVAELWTDVATRLARRAGYAAMAETFQRRAFRHTSLDLDLISRHLPPDRARQARSMTVPPRSAPAAPAPSDSLTPLVAELLRRPRLADYREKALSPPDVPSEIVACNWSPKCANASGLPAGFSPELAATAGGRTVALGSWSRDIPSSTGGPSGYWVVRSTGTGWDGPYYTGLLRNAPYVAVTSSKVTRDAGDHLDLEVRVEHVDFTKMAQVMPRGLVFKRESGSVVLELPWDLLRRDADSDGWTDLFEERLVLDPASADTDLDGIGDREDRVPHVRSRSAETSEAVLLETVLAKPMFGGRELKLVSFDRNHFPSRGTASQSIVLSPAEWDAYREKFDVIHPMRIDWFFMNRDGTKAIVMAESWMAYSTLRLERRDGVWTVVDSVSTVA